MVSGKQAKAARQAKMAAAAPPPSRARLWWGVGIALLAVAAIVTGIVIGTRNSAPSSASYPAGATSDNGGIVVNADKAKAGAPTLDIYEDFQCPACKQAEEIYGETITKLADAGTVRVVYHMRNFLEDNPGFTSQGATSSTRTANAAACAADAGRFLPFHDAVYAGQPASEGTGYSDAEIEGFAQTAGISGGALDTWKSCVKDKRYVDYVKRVDEATAKAGYTTTPTYVVAGKVIPGAQRATAQAFEAAVLAAAKSAAPASSTPSANAPAPSTPAASGASGAASK